MKTKTKLLFSTFGFVLFLQASLAHDIIVHQQITINAASSALTYSSAYDDFLNTISSDCSAAQAVGLMKVGSGLEDNVDIDAGGKRPFNHFYDPLDNQYGKGLSDFGEFHFLFGQNSFTWASISNSPGYNVAFNQGTSNVWSWANARDYEWLGLTSANPTDRRANLGYMFRAAGQVMHLLEDTSQPQHVRNENHLDYINPSGLSPHLFNGDFPSPWHSHIEDYGQDHWRTLNYGDGSMLDWRGAGFTKLEDFWDRHLYNGSAAALKSAEASGGQQLGLAEWCNGNFLGERHSYAEYFRPGDIEYYPYPSRNSGSNYKQIESNPSSGIDTFTFENGTQGKGIYYKKISDGVQITHQSRVTYLAAKFPNVFGSAFSTINDPNVLKDYHDQFIPKAVKYSAGLIDYFFRGTLAVSVLSYTNSQYITLIRNTSGQDFNSGSFYIYQDDVSGTRTLVTNWSGTLSANSSMTVGIPDSISPTNKLLLFYRGTIVENGKTPDPVDASIAIAAQSFDPKKTWYSGFEGGNGGTPSAGNYFAGGWYVDAGSVDLVSAAGWEPYQGNYSLDLDGLGPGTISTNITTVSGQTYELSFYYSHNPDGITDGTPDPAAEILINDTHLATIDSDTLNDFEDMQWTRASFEFTATSSSTKLTFHSLASAQYGLTLDAIELDISP